MPSVASHVVEFTFSGGFESLPLHTLIEEHLAAPTAQTFLTRGHHLEHNAEIETSFRMRLLRPILADLPAHLSDLLPTTESVC